MIEETDVAVVGAGPVGLFTVFALGQVGLKATVIDALDQLGGQCRALYPEKPIYDIPTRTSLTGSELIDDLLRQAEPYEPLYCLGRKVVTLSDRNGGFALGLSDGATVAAKAVVIAAGAGAFGPNRPPMSDIRSYEGQSVFYSIRDPEQFRGRRVVIAGGGDSAADWAGVLSDIASSTTLVHRRMAFRAAPGTMAVLERRIAQGRLTIAAPRTLHSLKGANGNLSDVVLTGSDGHKECIPADVLLCFFGLAKDLSVVSGWDLGTTANIIPVAPATMMTKRAGIYAVGDVAQYPGKLKLILTGFAEAALAAHNVRAYVKPQQAFHFEYSTSRGAPTLQGA